MSININVITGEVTEVEDEIVECLEGEQPIIPTTEVALKQQIADIKETVLQLESKINEMEI